MERVEVTQLVSGRVRVITEVDSAPKSYSFHYTPLTSGYFPHISKGKGVESAQRRQLLAERVTSEGLVLSTVSGVCA